MPEQQLSFADFPAPSQAQIEEAISKFLKGAEYSSLFWNAPDDLKLEPYYRIDTAHLSSRNTFLSQQMPASWLIRQGFSGGNAKELNGQILLALAGGVNGISIDLNPFSKSHFSSLLSEVSLEHITLQVTAEKEEKMNEFAGWLQENNHTVFELFLDCPELNSQEPFASLTKTCRSSHVSGLALRNEGASLIQETAFALSIANEKLNSGVPTTQIHFSLGIGTSYFLEIARLRAFRILWHNITSAHQQASPAYIHCKPYHVNKSVMDEENNLIRLTAESMAAAVGGCNSMAIDAYNTLSLLQDDAGQRYARNIQLMLHDESYLNAVRDAGAGSHYIEVLTNLIAESAWGLFQEIEGQGGFQKCHEEGFIDNLISSSREVQVSAYERGEQPLVGVNLHPNPKEMVSPPHSDIQGFRVAQATEAAMVNETANSEE